MSKSQLVDWNLPKSLIFQDIHIKKFDQNSKFDHIHIVIVRLLVYEVLNARFENFFIYTKFKKLILNTVYLIRKVQY